MLGLSKQIRVIFYLSLLLWILKLKTWDLDISGDCCGKMTLIVISTDHALSVMMVFVWTIYYLLQFLEHAWFRAHTNWLMSFH